MKSIITSIILIIFCCYLANSQVFSCRDAPAGVIWCDDFEDSLPLNQKYFEWTNNNGEFIIMPGVGRGGSKGMRIHWQQGEVEAGSLKKSFGRTPGSYIGKNAALSDSNFDEIYWRIDVKMQDGWQGGGPAKLSRALCLANENWATGAMAHLWSGGKQNLNLGMDPASGISTAGALVTTKYNDFDNLRWLGFKAGNIEMFSTENSGRWFCVEGHIQLNTPGGSDGIFEFWINDTLQAGSYNLNWHGTWNNDMNNYKINAIFFENYWNQGSPAEQERYFDNILISTERIGCDCGDTTKIEDMSPDGIEINNNNGYIGIRFNESIHAAAAVYDILGNTVFIAACAGSRQINIQTENLRPGLYFLLIKSNKKAIVKKIIIR